MAAGFKYKRGIFAKYHKAMPLPERISKDFRYGLRYIVNLIKTKGISKRMLVYPHYPSSGSTIYKIANHLGFSISNIPHKKYNIAVYWEYNTYRNEYQYPESLKNIPVINLYSRDIGKVFVDEAFKDVFGYSTFIDPETYTLPFVRKNDINAKHDGQIITSGNISPEPGYIYQRLIDNSTSDGMVLDYRVPVIINTLDFIYLKYRSREVRFTNSTSRTVVRKISDIFSPDEIEKINRFCKSINLEYGELDILRDNNDGRIYIVDVNNTPQGPPKHLNRTDNRQAIKKMSAAFKSYFLNG